MKLEITPPDGFIEEEIVTTWRAPLEKNLKAGLAMQFQAPVRPNLIATQRRVSNDTSLPELMSKVAADLLRHIEGLKLTDPIEFSFADGQTGLLLDYAMPVHGKFTVVQLQAGRLDGDVFTTLTISTEASRLDDDAKKHYLQMIAAAKVPAEES
ncbi:MAG: hypothetical protein RMA76_35500 [Deltaproteobacteria bacterium]|jgi:hypothetical protein